MADEEQLQVLRQGGPAWNAWRKRQGDQRIDLRGADLRGADLRGADLHGADLSGAKLGRAHLGRTTLRIADLHSADLNRADLHEADLHRASLVRADLRRANLGGTNLRMADLHGADLCDAKLNGADLRGALLQAADVRGAYLGGVVLGRTDLRGANLDGAILYETLLADLDLSTCKGLDSCVHHGPSIIDIRTSQRSGPLPLAFLRGVGLPDALIDYLPSLLNQAIQMYSCFISYSAKDEDFARRLHADLQDKGVRCWFAPEDMKIGAKILDTLDEAIRLRDKVLLVLSEAAIASEWVEDEVTKAFAEERERGGTVLFPIRVDDAVFETGEAWARKLRDNRNIGDFRGWKEHDAYRKALDRLLRDLRIEKTQRR